MPRSTAGSDPALREVRFTFQHKGCWLQETTERHPGAMLVVSGMYLVDQDVHLNVTLHTSDEALVDTVHAEWTGDPRVKRVTKVSGSPHGTRFHVAYDWEGSIYHHIIEHTPVSIGAVRVARGVEHYQMIGVLQDVQELLRLLGTKGHLEVLSIRDPGAASDMDATRDRPWAALTEKQIEAVIVAQASGYYQWPRERTAAEIAGSLGLSASAFLDHLRHAEAKLLAAVVERFGAEEPGRAQSILHRVRNAAPGKKR